MMAPILPTQMEGFFKMFMSYARQYPSSTEHRLASIWLRLEDFKADEINVLLHEQPFRTEVEVALRDWFFKIGSKVDLEPREPSRLDGALNYADLMSILKDWYNAAVTLMNRWQLAADHLDREEQEEDEEE